MSLNCGERTCAQKSQLCKTHVFIIKTHNKLVKYSSSCRSSYDLKNILTILNRLIEMFIIPELIFFSYTSSK